MCSVTRRTQAVLRLEVIKLSADLGSGRRDREDHPKVCRTLPRTRCDREDHPKVCRTLPRTRCDREDHPKVCRTLPRTLPRTRCDREDHPKVCRTLPRTLPRTRCDREDHPEVCRTLPRTLPRTRCDRETTPRTLPRTLPRTRCDIEDHPKVCRTLPRTRCDRETTPRSAGPSPGPGVTERPPRGTTVTGSDPQPPPGEPQPPPGDPQPPPGEPQPPPGDPQPPPGEPQPPPGEPQPPPGERAVAVLWSFGRSLAAVLPVYLAGCWGCSVLLVLLGLLLYVGWKQRRLEKLRRLRSAVELLDNERSVLRSKRDLPPWVNFPDVEKVEWLNKILHQAWPFVGQYLEKVLLETVAPAIRASSVHLQTLSFTKVNLGDKTGSSDVQVRSCMWRQGAT
ncbi:hypothetical protein CRUP_031804 [Coryphaenoides rupestris]|nr:hypothetical protein CRUP_031804 [Coryphaenoides rupestris]